MEKNFNLDTNYEDSSWEKLNVCDICGAKFILSSTVVCHMLEHHNIAQKCIKISSILSLCTKEDLLYSADSDSEYKVTTVIERVRKKKFKDASKFEKQFDNTDSVENVSVIKDNEAEYLYYPLEDNLSENSNDLVSKSADDERPILNRKTFDFDYCDQVVNEKNGLKNQINIIHDKQFNKLSKIYLCAACDRGFLKRQCLKVHSVVHSGERPFKCKYPGCNKSFRYNSGRHSHYICIHKPKEHQCPECGRYFAFARSLENHLTTHTGKRPFICPVCSKGFASKYCLRKHQELKTH